MDIIAPNIFGVAFILLSAIVIGYFLTQWYHKIDKRIRIQQAQMYILTKMAEKQGVEAEDILNAMNHANGHDTLEGKI